MTHHLKIESVEGGMSKDTLRQLANALSVLLALTINILANALPLNGQNTGAISDRLQVYFVPAGYVFAIWGVIYIGWIVFVIYQFQPAQKESPRLRRLGYLFALSGVANAAWLFCWHYNQVGLSVLVMLILLGLLIASYLRLGVGSTQNSTVEHWCLEVPFSVYLGWITVATVANISDWLFSINWSGWGITAQPWAAIMIGVASLLGVLMALTRWDDAYIFVLIWSFVGIAVKQTSSSLVMNSAWAASAFLLVLAIWCIIQRFRHL
jgi:hypothetical protein